MNIVKAKLTHVDPKHPALYQHYPYSPLSMPNLLTGFDNGSNPSM